MSIDLSAIPISPLMWLIILGAVVLIVYSIFRFFLGHLMHLFFRGCGLIVIVIALLYVLHLLKLI